MKVRVSAYYHGVDWYDPKSGLTFSKKDKEIDIPDNVNMYNINRYINLNYLDVINEEESTIKPDTIVRTAPNILLAEAEANAKANVEEVIEDIEDTVVEETVVDVETEITKPEVKEEIVVEEIKNEKVECQFCNKEYSTRGIASHERACKENPENQ